MRKRNGQWPLFIFEMANNHQGSLVHGLRIIHKFHQVSKPFPFRFAFKLQARDIPTFIHPDYQNRQDIKYVKRFSETRLTKGEFRRLKEEIKKLGFVAICTPFDEKSVDLIEELDFDIIKIGSCSSTDWPLLERISLTNKPIIASFGGTPLRDIDQVVSFFTHREKDLTIMHCVGQYPTPADHLQLNQIDLFHQRYPNLKVGFSTHEDPNNLDAIKMAVAKGATVFEKHIGLRTEKIDLNSYSATPIQTKLWLTAASKAFKAAGTKGQRMKFGQQELADLRKFKRGVYANKTIGKGERLTPNHIFFAWPNVEGQFLANEISKYTRLYAKKSIAKGKPIIEVKKINVRKKILAIIKRADKILKKAQVPLPSGRTDISVSYHYGLDKFNKVGAVLITCINREYCKKLIVMSSGQSLPLHRHKKKEETFHFLAGDWTVDLEGKKRTYKVGDILTVKRGVGHIIKAETDGVLEEVSSTHYPDDSYYDDPKITANKDRRTYVTYWLDSN